jgi:TatA/E family protein of Tat protein translocase
MMKGKWFHWRNRMGPLGWQETLVIFVIALLIFGPKKLPDLGKTIGKALTEFRKASSDLKSTWEREMVNLERESDSLREATSSISKELSDIGSSTGDASYDSLSSYASEENPSTVGASEPEGAESTEYAALEDDAGANEVAAAVEGGYTGDAVEDLPGEYGSVPDQVAASKTESEPESSTSSC